MTSSGSSSAFAGFRFRGGDRRGGPLVSALRPVQPGRRGTGWAERDITVDHATVYRWVQRFTPEFIEAARLCRLAPGDGWFADETYVKVAGRWTYLYRAIDQHGQVIDVLLSVRRDLAAARRFFTRALRAGTIPAEVTTDRAPACPRVPGGLIPSALHTVERDANNPVETDHGRLKRGCGRCAASKRHRSADPGSRTCTRAEPPPRPASGSAPPSTSS